VALIVTVLWDGFETVIYRFNGPGGLSVG